ncbi:MBOAT family O-acyltransferase [Legionella gresilensis]|uniref:MBOAT family O-acyltransferase n=1 Tax=Legionella gresilensis TaxID=91823 RepID=UPI00104142AC|nr:MBOAT family protein [Legionella gresilensis]
MVFSSPVFLFLFLPLLLSLYYLLHPRYRNIILLLGSLFFYAWGEPLYVLLMISSILFNWAIGLGIATISDKKGKFLILGFGVSVNLITLAYYKYAAFLISSFNIVLFKVLHFNLDVHNVILPVGISFFTFHAISYIVDVYRGQGYVLRNPLNMGLYISFFPQLVAGPIIRYHDIAKQLLNRTNSIARFSSGIERFVFGLGKKILIANTLGQIADQAFNTPNSSLSTSIAWFGLICYTLQIYFDFSGYSDMAVGLARLFGFELTENFNYPYISRSVREFWRRWHLSLSTWFRDYLYIPLGGNRGSWWRVRFNLFTVFFLCGLWHGASWNFVIWGMFHGILLVIERGGFGKKIDNAPAYMGHIYTLLMVMIGWVFFRADTLIYALVYLKTMFLGGHGHGFTPEMAIYLNSYTFFILIVAIITSCPILTFLARDWRNRLFPAHVQKGYIKFVEGLQLSDASLSLMATRFAVTSFILIGSVSKLATTTYNPFIYFRF